jgi:acetyltransferase-like isoleucine patch superfamily enzyme
VVTKDVPAMAVVVGNPGRVIRMLAEGVGEAERGEAMGSGGGEVR